MYYFQASTPSGIVDPVGENHFYYASRLPDALKKSTVAPITFGTIAQTHCPKTDLAAISVSQSHTGAISTHLELSDNEFSEVVVVDTPEPISFSWEYENKGPSSADQAQIR